MLKHRVSKGMRFFDASGGTGERIPPCLQGGWTLWPIFGQTDVNSVQKMGSINPLARRAPREQPLSLFLA